MCVCLCGGDICAFFLIHFRVTHDANVCSNATKIVHSKNKFEETNCFEWKRIVKKITCIHTHTHWHITHTHTHNIKRYKSISFLIILLLHFTLQIYKTLFCFICYVTLFLLVLLLLLFFFMTARWPNIPMFLLTKMKKKKKRKEKTD